MKIIYQSTGIAKIEIKSRITLHFKQVRDLRKHCRYIMECRLLEPGLYALKMSPAVGDESLAI